MRDCELALVIEIQTRMKILVLTGNLIENFVIMLMLRLLYYANERFVTFHDFYMMSTLEF